jgi:hypothetical protein
MDDNQNIWEIQRQQYHQWEIQYWRYQWEIDRHQRYTLLLALNVNRVLIASTLLKPTRTKEPYHTSVLTGEGWLLELMAGHPERIRCELGVCLHVFTELLAQLRRLGHTNTRAVSLEEQVAIFLYMCITGLTTRHVGERFQRSTSTISR